MSTTTNQPNSSSTIDQYIAAKILDEINRTIPEAENKDAIVQKLCKTVKEDIESDIHFQIENLVRDIQKERIKEVKRLAKEKEKAAEYFLPRFSLMFRAQHAIMFVSVILLVITGLPVKFHQSDAARFFFSLTGGIQVTAFIHRIGAFGLGIVSAIHLFYIVFTKEGRGDFFQFIPTPKDVRDVIMNLKYFFGLSKAKPMFARFSYVEKFDYWAVYWGMVIMLGSGVLLTFETNAMNLLSKELIDIAKEMHSDEALLATLAIVIWHFYNVHFNPKKFPINMSFWTGKIRLDEIMEEHPLELKKLIQENKIDKSKVEKIRQLDKDFFKNVGLE